MFAVTQPKPSTVSLKCEPHFAEHLRSQHRAIAPGYHLNKRHWNTVRLDGSLPDGLVEELLGHSYTLVVDRLPQRERQAMHARVALQRGRQLVEVAAFRTGDYDAAEEELNEVRAVAEASGDQATLAGALDQLGAVRHYRNLDLRQPDGTFAGDPAWVDEELALVERALAMRRELGDESAIAESTFRVGLVHQLFTGRWDLAEERFQEAHALAERAGDTLLRSEVHRHLGVVRWHARDWDAAIRELERSLDLRYEAGATDWIPGGLTALGTCKIEVGRRAEGIEDLRRGIEMMERLGQLPSRVDQARRALEAAIAEQEQEKEGGA